MAAKKRGSGTAKTVVRLSLPVICTVALSGAGLNSALAFEPPAGGGGQQAELSVSNVEGGNGNGGVSGADTGGGGTGGTFGTSNDGGGNGGGGAFGNGGTGTDNTNTNTNTNNNNDNNTNSNDTNNNLSDYVGSNNYSPTNTNTDGSGSTDNNDTNKNTTENATNVNDTDKKDDGDAKENGENLSENKGTGDQSVDGTGEQSGQGAGEEGDAPQAGTMMFSTYVAANPGTGNESGQQQRVSYDYNAELYKDVLRENNIPNNKEYAGVYATAELKANAEGGTGTTVYENDNSQNVVGTVVTASTVNEIGMPSIADDNLKNEPTTESPAIIVGAAVGYEKKKDGEVGFDTLKERDIPYSEFKWQIMEEANSPEPVATVNDAGVTWNPETRKTEIGTNTNANANANDANANANDANANANDANANNANGGGANGSSGADSTAGQTGTHAKLTGYDGTYVIVRLDVTDFFRATGLDGSAYDDTAYLHVKQEDNNTLLTAIGMASVTNGLQVSGPTLVDEKTKAVTTLTDGNTFTGIPSSPATKETTVTNQDGTSTTYTLKWEDASNTSKNVIRTASYKRSDLWDKEADKAYLDVLVFATASNVAGADVGKTGALTGDVPVSMYVDHIDDYDPTLTYDPASQDPYHTANCLGKFYDATRAVRQATETVKDAAANIVQISKYVVKGSHLALETMVENSDRTGSKTTYWSLRKGFENTYYDRWIDQFENDGRSGRTLSLMSEVAVVEDLNLVGTNRLRKRTLDVNSFDVQIATNTGQTGTQKVNFNLKNAWLTVADLSNTTGSELAIGNNSKFVIDEGGRLIIDETCQLEIEWDGATHSSTGQSGETTPQEPDILNNGMLDLLKGGTLVNNGVITIEGTEGKPIKKTDDPESVTVERGYGEFLVAEGATLINNGSMLVYGKLYNLGTIRNNGKYEDTIDSTDPDKGTFSYHKGIQVSWKDDVRQKGIDPGVIYNGRDKNGNEVKGATILNYGDIVLVPGTIENYATLDNRAGARVLEAPVSKAIIPVEPTPEDQTESMWITISPAKQSYINNHGTIVNRGTFGTAAVALNTNLSFGEMTFPGNPDAFNITNDGTINNYGIIPGMETEVDPNPPIEPHPSPQPDISPSGNDDMARRLTPWAPFVVDTDTEQDEGSTGGTDVANNVPTTIGAIRRLQRGRESMVTEAGSDVSVATDSTLEEIADGVFEVVSMPEVDVEALVANDPDHDADDVAEIWWCVYIDGVLVRVMDAYGNLAPGIARIIWADNVDLAKASLVGVDLGDGIVIYLTPDTELFLEVLWS